MASRGLSDEDVGAAIGRSRVSVSRYRRGLIRPEFDVIQKIRAFSGGKVTEADWRHLRDDQPEARRAAR
ncbi:MAG: helix-turn-helix transcriptional regulator [Pseudorhodoplanes sp.]|nr:helix-turn-helix transcriptional regulator [Pseudorhodoplanes sp.]